MPRVVLVKRGEKCLLGMQMSELEEMYRHEHPDKSSDSLHAAVLRKRGRVLKEMARTFGRGISTVYRWLFRIERQGLECKHDTKSHPSYTTSSLQAMGR